MFGLVSKEAKKIVHISLMHLVQKILRIAFNHFFIELFFITIMAVILIFYIAVLFYSTFQDVHFTSSRGLSSFECAKVF